jgi:hypothetical protein
MFSAFRAMLAKELEEIGHTVQICQQRMRKRNEFAANNNEDILADSLAACLHSFYSGLENLFKTIALELDESIPKGDRWHKKLLWQMATPIPQNRDRVLSERSLKYLEEFRAFRHLFRNLYTHNINPERVFLLGGKLPESWQSIQHDLNNFINFLEKIDADRIN